jgi:hypothetical protein
VQFCVGSGPVAMMNCCHTLLASLAILVLCSCRKMSVRLRHRRSCQWDVCQTEAQVKLSVRCLSDWGTGEVVSEMSVRLRHRRSCQWDGCQTETQAKLSVRCLSDWGTGEVVSELAVRLRHRWSCQWDVCQTEAQVKLSVRCLSDWGTGEAVSEMAVRLRHRWSCGYFAAARALSYSHAVQVISSLSVLLHPS